MQFPPSNLLDNQKMIFDAIEEMRNGKRLYDQGLTTFMNLTGGGSLKSVETKVQKLARSVPAVTASDEDVATRIVDAIRGKGMAANGLTRLLHIDGKRTRRVLDGLKNRGEIQQVGSGNTAVWVLVEPQPAERTLKARKATANRTVTRTTKTSSKKQDFGQLAPICKKIVETIQSDAWVTTATLVRTLRSDPHHIRDGIKLLEAAGLLSRVTKRHNPAHKQKNQPHVYLRVASDVHVDATTARVPHSRVRYEDCADEVLTGIRDCDGWASTAVLEKKLKISNEPLRRILQRLLKDKRVYIVNKTNNPAHADMPKAYGRTRPYWVEA